MIVTKTFLMPDYYTSFKCKTGDCRRSCCEGWQVTFSLDDYFRLESEECSPELRDRIDRGVKVSLHPTPEAYAVVNRDYYGNCPMRLEDGRCAIHAEMGEGALATVCRLYPRGIRTVPDYECSMTNSCEGVAEMLLDRSEPVKFIRQTLTVDVPVDNGRAYNFKTFGREQEIRLKLISILQDRSRPLYRRLTALGSALEDVGRAVESADESITEEFLSKEYRAESIDAAVTAERLEDGLKTARAFLELIDEDSVSVREYGSRALEYFYGAGLEKYFGAEKKFRSIVPEWENWFENILVNHMFFQQFPFQDRPDSPGDEYVAVCSVYAMMRFLCLGCACTASDKSDITDIIAALFRLVDHTDFDRYASARLKSLGCDSPSEISDLILL